MARPRLSAALARPLAMMLLVATAALWPAIAAAQPQPTPPLPAAPPPPANPPPAPGDGAAPADASTPDSPPPDNPPPRLAESARERARALVREGADLYEKQGDRVGAVSKFEQAYAIYPAPEILFNLGLAYRDIGRNALAHRALSGFLDTLGFPDEARLRQAEDALRELEPLVGRFLILAPYRDGGSIRIDGEPVGTAPLAHPIAVEPGIHEVTVWVDGKEVGFEQAAGVTGKVVRVKLWRARGQKVGLPAVTGRATTDPDLLAESPHRARTPLYKRWWLWTAVGVVAAGAAVYFGARPDTINDVDPSLGRFSFDQF